MKRTETPETVAAFVSIYLDFVAGDYLTRQPKNIRAGLDKLVRHCGDLPLPEFRALRLQDFRDALVRGELSDDTLSREYINRICRYVKQAWKWGVSREIIAPDAYASLCAVEPLKAGRTIAPETDPVEPVDPELVQAVMGHLPPDIADMVKLLCLTGARTGEIRRMIQGDIDMSRDDVWLFRPGSFKPKGGRRITHKTAHHGKVRVIPLDELCQQVLFPRMQPFLPETPVFPSPRSGGFYGEQAVYNAVRRACQATGLAYFHPHQIRHYVLTQARRVAGGDRDALQSLAGHSSFTTTERYARCTDDAAIRGLQALRRAGAS